MRGLGLLLPGFAPDVAVAAERNGFESLWLRDGPLHAYTLLCALATVTSSARLGGLATDVGGRNPAIVAKQVTTLDLVSHGRAVLTLGCAPRDDDARRLEEAVLVARRMFTDDRPAFEGRYYRADAALNHPPPVQRGGPPVLVAGHVDVAARHADGVVLGCDAAVLGAELAVVARCCGESGRDPSTLTTVWLPPVAGSPEAVAEAGFGAGIDTVVLDLGAAGPDAVAELGRTVRKPAGYGQ